MAKLSKGLMTDGAWTGMDPNLSGAGLQGTLINMLSINPLGMQSALIVGHGGSLVPK